MEKENRKTYVKIDRETGSDEIFAMLDQIESETESDVENLLEDSDTEYIAEEDVPDENVESHEVLVPEATVHVIGESNNEEEPPSKKLKKKIFKMNWNRKPNFVKTSKCRLEENIILDIPENATPIDIFEKTTNLDVLVDLITEQTNLYAAQNGREFVTSKEEIRAFLGINFIMSVSKLPNLKCYWNVDSFFSNDGVRNAITRTRFTSILQNLHFADNESADKSDKGYKMRTVITHLNEAFREAVSDASKQSIDEHMTKFKGKMSCKQYMKNKPIKWGFKWWCRCSSKTGYLYEFDLYLGKKEKTEFGLGETVVLNLSKRLEKTYCMLFFDNFFNSPMLVYKLYERGIYSVGTVRSDRKNMAIMKKDKDMERGDVDFQYAENVFAVKWFDNRGVTLVGTCQLGCNRVSSVLRRVKGQAAKIAVTCPEVIKDYNSGMGGVDLLDQRTAAYKLDRKSSGGRYYLRLFFDLMDMSVVNSHVVYKGLNPKGMELLDFKIVVAKSLIGTYNNRIRSSSLSHASRREVFPSSTPLHLPIIQATRGKCRYCSAGGVENKTYIQCNTCGVYLCLITGNNSRNCFANFHIHV